MQHQHYGKPTSSHKHDFHNVHLLHQNLTHNENDGVIPNRIGHYLLKETIGHGAFSVVKHAIDINTNEEFCCKIISKKRIIGKDMEIRFEKEVRILQQLSHQGVVTLYDIIKDSINYYLFMELCPNGTLFDFIVSKSKIPEDEAKYIFKQIVIALKYIHSQNVVHRDIKPENILINEKLNVKFIDFGFSTHYDPDNLLKTNCHTPNYASPQCLSGLPNDGQKSDIWSLGILLYVMLNGKVPWTSKNQKQFIEEIRNANVFLPFSMSEDARDLLSKIIVKDADKRISIDQILEHPWLQDIYVDQFHSTQSNNKLVRLNDVDQFFKNSFKSCNVLNFTNSHLLTEGKIALARANRCPTKDFHKNKKINLCKVKSFE